MKILTKIAASSLWHELRIDWAYRRFKAARSHAQRLRALNAIRDLVYLREQAAIARRR
jgi:hypothetical protein